MKPKEDGQNNRNARQYRNKTVCAGCTDRTLVYLSLFFCLFTLCHASFSALQVVFSNCFYKGTVKWDICQIFNKTINKFKT